MHKLKMMRKSLRLVLLVMFIGVCPLSTGLPFEDILLTSAYQLAQASPSQNIQSTEKAKSVISISLGDPQQIFYLQDLYLCRVLLKSTSVCPVSELSD